jgi:transposase
MQVTTIGLDLAKHVFQVHGIDAAEKVIVRKQLRRASRRSSTMSQDTRAG